MKKLAVAFLLALTLAVAVVSPTMADGPGINGQGGDPSWAAHPPNDVWVPSSAYDARGELPPGNSVDNNGAVFHLASPGGG